MVIRPEQRLSAKEHKILRAGALQLLNRGALKNTFEVFEGPLLRHYGLCIMQTFRTCCLMEGRLSFWSGITGLMNWRDVARGCRMSALQVFLRELIVRAWLLGATQPKVGENDSGLGLGLWC